jgi:FkbM family methyltransferase
MFPELGAILFLGIGVCGSWNGHKKIFFNSWPVPLAGLLTAPRGMGRIFVSRGELPLVNCQDYSRFPKAKGYPSQVFSAVQSMFGDFASSRRVLSRWLNAFHPDNLYAQEVLEVFKRLIAVGIQCGRLFNLGPATMHSYLAEYRRTTRRLEARKYHGISNECPEVFLFHHGLRRLDPRIRSQLKNKSVLDIGAFTGDSALVLSEYAKDMYGIGLSLTNYAVLKRVLAQNPALSSNVRTFHMAVSDADGQTNSTGSGGGARISNGPGEQITMISVDTFVDRYNLSVGFIKADVEGYAFAVVKGAAKTLARDRPVFSFSTYHDFSEMYNVSVFLMNSLHQYYFEWHMEKNVGSVFFELSFFGRPKQRWELFME